jgi:hypothetical protein
MTVDFDRIGSLVNTLVLAYSAGLLPAIIQQSGTPVRSLLKLEPFAAEIVSMLVGSSGLILAAPLTTFVAADLLRGTGPCAHHAVEDLAAEVATPRVVWSEARHIGVILAFMDPHGEPSNLTSQGAGFDLLPEELPEPMLEQAGHVHLTAWSFFTDPPRQAVLRAPHSAR